MDQLILTRDLVARGFTGSELTRRLRQPDLVRVRRGAYARLPVEEPGDDAGLGRDHRRLVDATLCQLHPRAVLSHGSAAMLWDLPLFRAAVDQVHVTRDRRGGGAIRKWVRVHGSPLSPADRTLRDDIPVTSLSRTVCDLARTLSFAQAVSIGDRALAIGLEPALLADSLEQAAGWYGTPQARRVAGFIDARSESVGESYSRVRFDEYGLAVPVLQYEVFDELGRLLARSDFAWLEQRTLGEFDGAVKYGKLLRPGETAEQVIMREKRRENVLRDLGWELIRWDWTDLFDFDDVAARLERAFGRWQARSG